MKLKNTPALGDGQRTPKVCSSLRKDFESERDIPQVPNDFLADSCGGPIVEADYTGLRAWLVSLGLPMYEPLFLEARISTLARVADLREPDFRTLGISNARHVRLLSSAVGALHFEQSRYSLEVR